MSDTVCCTICGALIVEQCICRMGTKYTQNDDPGREMEVAVLRDRLAAKDAEIERLRELEARWRLRLLWLCNSATGSLSKRIEAVRRELQELPPTNIPGEMAMRSKAEEGGEG